MHLRSFVVSPIGSNCYVLAENDTAGASAVIVDPGDVHLEPVLEYIEERQFKIVAIWCTHGHFDHVLGVDVERKHHPVPVYCHAADLALWDNAHHSAARWLGVEMEPLKRPDKLWEDNTSVLLGSTEWRILHTPGHSEGGVCIVHGKHAFTGDTLFAGTIGRVDFPESDAKAMRASLERLKELDDDIVIYPGHGTKSTIGHEKQTNPYLVQNLL